MKWKGRDLVRLYWILKTYWIFFVIFTVGVLVLSKIIRMTKDNPKVKKFIWVLCGILLMISIFVLGKVALQTQTIGTISGPEYEKITIDDVTYEIDYNHDFSNASKGKFLGIIRSGDSVFRIYSVKGDDQNQYIYRLWGYEGAFYKKKICK